MKTTIKSLRAERAKIDEKLNELDQDFRGLDLPFFAGSESHRETSEEVSSLFWKISMKIRRTFIPQITYKDKKADIERKVNEGWEILSNIQNEAMEVLDQTYLLLASGK